VRGAALEGRDVGRHTLPRRHAGEKRCGRVDRSDVW